MEILRAIDRERFKLDFLVLSSSPGSYDAEVEALGSRVIACRDPFKPWVFWRDFNDILRRYGPFDIVHSHVHFYSGFVSLIARNANVPVRIVHSHNSVPTAQAPRLRRLYAATMRAGIWRYATGGLAASRRAALALYGPKWEAEGRWRILYYSIDLTQFKGPLQRNLRSELRIPTDAFVIGHVGRFVEQKNHRFIVDVLSEAVKRRPKTRLLLVGDGPGRLEIEKLVESRSLKEHVIFAGVRTDVANIMREVIDVFVFPSLFEGLPLVLLEAQAAGLPCVVSEAITDEATVVEALVKRVSLSKSASIWAGHIFAVRPRTDMSAEQALEAVENSPFNIKQGVKELSRYYAACRNLAYE